MEKKEEAIWLLCMTPGIYSRLKVTRCHPYYTTWQPWPIAYYQKRQDAIALNNLAMSYLFGVSGTPQNVSKALEILEQGEKRGHVVAICNLAICRAYNIYTNDDPDKEETREKSHPCWETLYKTLVQYSNSNYPAIAFNIAYCHYAGMGTPINLAQAAKEFESLIPKFPPACRHASYAYCALNDTKNAWTFMHKAVDGIDPSPQAKQALADLYLTCTDTKTQNRNLAVAMFLAADTFTIHCPAKENVGWCYEFGAGGLEKNLKKAFELYHESAMKGSVHGMLQTGICYEEGKGVEKADKDLARLWYTRAGRHNCAEALLRAHPLYPAENTLLAHIAIRKAAELGHPHAQVFSSFFFFIF